MSNEYPVEASTTIKSPIDWAKQNPVGAQPTEQGGHPLIQNARESMIAGTDELSRALENRFAQPNWLKVSAAFAKPQLGGFGASFGSAMEELGKQEEARRSIAPTVARMKAEVAAGQYGQSQRIVQQEKYNELRARKPDPKTWTEDEVQSVYKYDTTSPIAEAIVKETGIGSTRAGTQSTRAHTSAFAQTESMEKPWIQLSEFGPKGSVADKSDAQVAEALTALDNAMPPGYDPKAWKALGYSEKVAARTAYDKKLSDENATEYQKAFERNTEANTVVNRLDKIRSLATDKEVGPLFSYLDNGDLFSMYRAYLDKNPGKPASAVEGLVNALFKGQQNVTPEARKKFDMLIKEVAQLEVDLRNSGANPTDAYGVLTSNASPSLRNSQTGFLGIVDQLALNADREKALYNFRINNNLSKFDPISNTERDKINLMYSDMAKELAKKNPLEFKPQFYEYSGTGIGKSAGKRAEASAQTGNRQPAARQRQAYTGNDAIVQQLGLGTGGQ